MFKRNLINRYCLGPEVMAWTCRCQVCPFCLYARAAGIFPGCASYACGLQVCWARPCCLLRLGCRSVHSLFVGPPMIVSMQLGPCRTALILRGWTWFALFGHHLRAKLSVEKPSVLRGAACSTNDQQSHRFSRFHSVPIMRRSIEIPGHLRKQGFWQLKVGTGTHFRACRTSTGASTWRGHVHGVRFSHADCSSR